MEKRIVTDNGITIYSYPNDALHSFCISFYVKFGCLFESEDESGLAHFLEHITFRNINCSYNGELYRILDKNGLTFNASTYKEFIHFYITGAIKHFDTAMEIISKVLLPIDVSSDEFHLEKKRIKAEIREEDYRTSLECFTNEIVWRGTSLTRSICGTCSSIDKISIKKLTEYQKKFFSADNVFFYITGAASDNNIESAVTVIEQYQVEKGVAYSNIAKIPQSFGTRSGGVYLKNCSYSLVRFSFDIDTSKYADAAMELFFDIMFSGDSCIIFQNLSEKSGLVYGYDARFAKYNNIGNIYFSYEVQSNKVEETVKIVVESLKGLKNGVGDKIDYVLAPYVDNAMVLFDNPEEFNWNRAYENHILNCNYPDIETRIKAFSSVTADDLTVIANDILRTDNIVVTLKGNKNKIDCDKIKNIVAEI